MKAKFRIWLPDAARCTTDHDTDMGCNGTLTCGSNNCRNFGTYYHERDDCCEKPKLQLQSKNFQLVEAKDPMVFQV